MQKKTKWLWVILLSIYIFLAVSSALEFFKEDSNHQIYYQVLISFNPVFLFQYLANILAVIFDLLAIIPFYAFVYPSESNKLLSFFSKTTLKWFLAIRIALLIPGHSFAYKQIQAIYLEDFWLTLSVISLMIMLYAPSYYVNFVFTYQQEEKAT